MDMSPEFIDERAMYSNNNAEYMMAAGYGGAPGWVFRQKTSNPLPCMHVLSVCENVLAQKIKCLQSHAFRSAHKSTESTIMTSLSATYTSSVTKALGNETVFLSKSSFKSWCLRVACPHQIVVLLRMCRWTTCHTIFFGIFLIAESFFVDLTKNN